VIRAALVLLFVPLLAAASAPVQPAGESLDNALQRARAEQSSAEAETRRLEQIAANARGEAARLQAQQAAAAQAIEAAEARITAADANLRLISAAADLRRSQLQREQAPIAALLSGLVMMGRRPPLLTIADSGANGDELVRVRVLLDSTLPVIRARTAALSAQLGQAARLEAQARAAAADLTSSRQQLVARREQFVALETRALQASATAQGQALASGDVALAAGEDAASLGSSESRRRAAWAIAAQLADEDPAPLRPIQPEGLGGRPSFAYVLPAQAPVTQGLGSVDANGVRSRGIRLSIGRGTALLVPASGTIRFAGPFRSHDGVVIIDHGGGWMSLIVNVATTLKPGDRVELGQPLGRALGAIDVELSQNGLKVSPALIAGSSQTLSNKAKGG
jgi:septal ring factor EnvC (AmiA/AmiB activator)